MDENVNGAITRELRKRGHDILTVQEDGRGGQPDPEAWVRTSLTPVEPLSLTRNLAGDVSPEPEPERPPALPISR